MESPPSSPAKLKLWRWLLLLSVATVSLGVFIWWKSRSERLQFVETIWLDSLAGHENDSATGQRTKVGEVLSLMHSSGLDLFGRGERFVFEERSPVLAT